MKTKTKGKLMGGGFLNSLKWVFVMALLPTTTPINAFKVYTRIVKLVQNTSTKDYDTQVVSDMVPYIHAWYDEDNKSHELLWGAIISRLPMRLLSPSKTELHRSGTTMTTAT